MDDLKESLRRARSSASAPEPAFERLVRRRERKRRNGRIASAAVALVVVAGIVTGGVWTLGHRSSRTSVHVGGSGQTVTSAPSPGLTAPAIVAAPGQYYYWKSVRPLPGGAVVEELWWGTDGSGRYEVDAINDNYGTPKSQTWQPGELPGVWPFENDVSGLSTDPATLLQQLLDRSSENGASPEPDVTIAPGISPVTSRMWRSVQNMLEQGTATPALRAAIFEVTAGLDGVQERAGVTDPVGRPAISLSVPLAQYQGGCTDTMWFDPDTHVLLASNGDLGCSPSLIIVAGGIVDSTSDTVALGDGFVPAPEDVVPPGATPTEGTEGHVAPAPSPSSATSR